MLSIINKYTLLFSRTSNLKKKYQVLKNLKSRILMYVLDNIKYFNNILK